MQGARTGLSGMQPCSMSESPCRSNSSGAASYLDGEPTEGTRAMPSTNQHRAHPPGSSSARCSIPTAWRPHDDMRAPQQSCVLARSKQQAAPSRPAWHLQACPARCPAGLREHWRQGACCSQGPTVNPANPQPDALLSPSLAEATRWPLERLSWNRASADGPAVRDPLRLCAAMQARHCALQRRPHTHAPLHRRPRVPPLEAVHFRPPSRPENCDFGLYCQ